MALPEYPSSSFGKGAIELTVNALIVQPIEADDATQERARDTETPPFQGYLLLAASSGPEIAISGEPFPETACSIPTSMCPDLIRNTGNGVVRIIDSTAYDGKVIAGFPVINAC